MNLNKTWYWNTFNGTLDEAADTRSLEYHYDLYETVKHLNDYLCITFFIM